MSLFKFLTSRTFFIQAFLALAIVVGFTFLVIQFLDFRTNHGQEIKVPDLAKMKLEIAEEKLNELDLEVFLLDTVEFNADFPPFTILEQDPKAGSLVKDGRKVYVKLNAGEFTDITIPAFTYLTSEDEKAHYELHNNDVNDVRYQHFVSPIVNAILHDFTPNDTGLDFGSGTGPVVSKMLCDQGFQMENYDLYFENKPELLTQKYNYISCCEVMEHFKQPLQEFQLLHKMLLPNGKLYCKTEIFKNQKPFENWYYKDDFTHVFIYQPKTLEWIKTEFDFSNVIIKEKLIVFEN